MLRTGRQISQIKKIEEKVLTTENTESTDIFSHRDTENAEKELATDSHRAAEPSACLCDARTQTGVSTRTGRQPKELNACLREYTHRQAKDEKSQRRVALSQNEWVTLKKIKNKNDRITPPSRFARHLP